MGSLWRALSVLVDESILSFRAMRRPPAMAGDAGLAPPAFETLAAEHAARPPEAILPSAISRDPAHPTRLLLRFPALGVTSIGDFHPSGAIPPDTLVLYHHGLAEFPHDATARGILTRANADARFDWACIQAPHHEDQRTVGSRLLASQASFGRCLLGSVYALRALAQALQARFGYRHVALAGMSMGGVITLLDASLEGSPFGLHVPLMAGPDLADVILRSSFAKIVSPLMRRAAAASPDLDRLDLALRLQGAGTPIRAVLSTHDRLFRLAAHRAGYARIPRAGVLEIDAGHVTGALRFGTLARHVRGALEADLWPAARPAIGHARAALGAGHEPLGPPQVAAAA